MTKQQPGRDPKQAKGETEQGVPAAGPQAAAHEDGALGALRSIVFGDLQQQQEQAIARLQSRILAHSETLHGELDALARRLESRIEELDARTTRDRSDLREQMATQKNLLSQSIDERTSQVTQLVNEGVADLRSSKFENEQFSGFLAGLAAHLEKQAPGDAESVKE